MLKNKKGVFILLALFLIPLWVLMVINMGNHFQSKRDITTEIMLTRQYFDYQDMEYSEKKYFNFAPEILTAFGTLDRNDRVTFIKENWRLSQLLHFENPYEVGFGTCTLETFFDDTVEHKHGETGLFAIKLLTGKMAQWIIDTQMPEHISRKMKVNIRTKEDLKDIVTSMRCAYALYWYYRKMFDDNEAWYVSAYHWGEGRIFQYWYEKYLPEKFTLNGIEYGVRNYHIAHREVVVNYSQGRLEAISDVVRRYKKTEHKIVSEELTFRKMLRIVKNLKKARKEYEEALDTKNDKMEDWKNIESKAMKDMIKISGEAKAGGGKKALRKVKNVAKWILKKLGIRK